MHAGLGRLLTTYKTGKLHTYKWNGQTSCETVPTLYSMHRIPIILASYNMLFIHEHCQMTHMFISEHVLRPHFVFNIHSLVRWFARSFASHRDNLICIYIFTSFLFREKCKRESASLVYTSIMFCSSPATGLIRALKI